MHFLLMGGFVDCSKRLPIIETDLGNQGILREIGSVKKRDINDHTKSDALSKTVTALQTVWFVVQCIARTGMGFALSEIELSALSFAIIHFLTYIFWWEKPRGVERAIVLPVDCSNGPTAYSMWSSTTSESCRGQRQINIDINDPHAINQQLDHLQHRSRTDRLTAARKYLPSLLQWILGQYEILLGIDPPNAPVRILLQHIPALGMIIEAADVQPHTRPFNVRLWSEQPRQIAQHKSAVNIPTIVVGFIVGLIFGGVHLLGWNLYFPTRAEKVIWRVCSLVLIFAPPLFVIYPKGDPDEVIGKPILARLKYYVCKGLATAVIPSYILARLTLLLLGFLSLRDLPPTALRTVPWVTSIPHF
jgi:hypothetical protein